MAEVLLHTTNEEDTRRTCAVSEALDGRTALVVALVATPND